MPHKVVDRVAWCPNESICILAVANEETVHLIHPDLGTSEVNKATRDLVREASKNYRLEAAAADKKELHCTWEFKDEMTTLTLKHLISNLCWHPKGDYFSTMAHNLQATTQVLIHSVSKATS